MPREFSPAVPPPGSAARERRHGANSLAGMVVRSWRTTSFAIGAAALSAAAIFVVNFFVLQPQTNKAIATRAVVRQLHEGMLDQETSLRGYVATRAPDMLEPYNSGVVTAARALTELTATAYRIRGDVTPLRAAQLRWERQWATPAATGQPVDSSRPSIERFFEQGKGLFDTYRLRENTVLAFVDRRVQTLELEQAIFLAAAVALMIAMLALALLSGRRRYREMRRSISDPAQRLLDWMDRYSSDVTPPSVDPEAASEIQEIESGLASMVSRMRSTQERELATRAKAAAAAERQAARLAGVVASQEAIARASLQVEAIAEAATAGLLEVLDASASGLAVADGDHLRFIGGSGDTAHGPDELLGRRIPMEGTAAGLCLRTRQPLISDDMLTDPRVDATAHRGLNARSMVIAPLLHWSTGGVLIVWSDEPAAFDRADAGVVELMSGVIGFALTHAEAYSTRGALVEAKSAALVDLERSNQDLAQFAYIASHDLSEPLRAITGFTQLLVEETRGQGGPEVAEYGDFITGGVERMRALIAGLLEYSRAGSGPPDGIERRTADVAEIVDQIVIDLAPTIADNAAVVRVATVLPTVPGDPISMRQVFQNLVSNALKFRRLDRQHTVTVSAQERADEFEFSVADNGIGINPDYREKVFAMFQRLNRREDFGGTGIGLAVARKIVERNGGRIWIEDTPGGGATFLFSVPKSRLRPNATTSTRPAPHDRLVSAS